MQASEDHQLTGQDAGNYHIRRLLGKGPLSHFYEAQALSGQRVMLTLFSLPATTSAQAQAYFLQRFLQQGPVLTQLKHPAIIPIHDYGEHTGYPYLITPFVPGSSLAQLLRSQGHFSIEATLSVLRQVAAGLDYAHNKGILHGSLSTANIVQGSGDALQIAGFGFMHILSQQRVGLDNSSDDRLVNMAKMLTGTPARMAPEMIASAIGRNAPFDARVDIYALGILLFELLSGQLPFSGETPYEVMQQHAQLAIPSIAALYPTLPISIDAVVKKALALHPEQRFQSAGELARAVEQALSNQATYTGELASEITAPIPMHEEKSTTNNYVASSYPKLTLPLSSVHAPQKSDASEFDPFVWWTSVSPTQTVTHPKITRAALNATQKLTKRKQDRRKVVAMLTAGSVVAVVGLGGGTIALAHMLHPTAQPQTANTQSQVLAPTATPQPPTAATKPTTAPTAKPKKPTPTAQPQQKPTATTTNTAPTPTQSAPTPTPQPPTPTPVPQHIGTVIGSTSMGTNSAKNFSNPANGNGSILVHLPNGNFVAYSTSCTHAGVQVYYDGGSSKLRCPAHGAVFDPANNGNPISGPNNGPLAGVTIHVNGDGTITA